VTAILSDGCDRHDIEKEDCGGSHNIQADCPDENVMTMVDEAMRR